MRACLAAVILVITSGFAPAYAITLERPLDDAAQEARAKALFETVRCVVCSGQALAESDARHAIDMRRTIRDLIHDGQSDTAIHQYLIARYGEDVLLNPPTNSHTVVLWLAPVIFILIGIGIWAAHLRKRRQIGAGS